MPTDPARCNLATPAPPPAHLPARTPDASLGGSRRPRVLILDTGLATVADGNARSAEHQWLRQHVGVCGNWTDVPNIDGVDEEDERDVDGTGFLDTQAGHGTFIAGIVSRLAPDAEIAVQGVLTSFGDGDDFTIATGIDNGINTLGCEPDVLVLSLGCYTDDDGPPPVVASRLRALRNTVVVAAAGNYGSCRRFWPAAMDTVVGVAALDCTHKAWFSNYGPWVDASAPGVDVLSTFFEPSGGFATTGWARWSGTSFAAPKVAAAIANEQWRSQGTAADAKARVLDAPGLFRIPELGVVVNLA